MSEQAELTIQDYLLILKRRWLYILVPFLLITSLSFVVAVMMPPVYESSGTILVESQQIPDELIRSTVTNIADEQIEKIQQLVMTRENLLNISEEYGLFRELEDRLTVTERIDMFRNRVTITKLDTGSSSNNRRNQSTLAFTVGFEDRSPDTAHRVANELVTLFLDENVKSRTERASETTEFLSDEANKLQIQLEELEGRIAAYKQENSNALPEHLDLHISMLDRTESALREIDQNIKATEDEVRFLQVEKTAIQRGTTSNNGSGINTPAEELAIAEADLTALLSRYSDLHPDVVRTRRQITELRNEIANLDQQNGGSGLDRNGVQDIDAARIEARMATAENTIASLQEQKIDLEARRTELETFIVQTPQVQRALVSLNRDYENMLDKYEEIQGKEMEARLAESLEEGKKAERFLLLEPPIKPESPIKPDRNKIFALGLFVAIGASVGLTGALEMSDKRIRNTEALTMLLGERPLVSIPYITTVEEVYGRKKIYIWLVTGFLASICIALIALHFLYMPIDLLTYKILERLG